MGQPKYENIEVPIPQFWDMTGGHTRITILHKAGIPYSYARNFGDVTFSELPDDLKNLLKSQPPQRTVKRAADKVAYVSPPLAELNITMIRDANPTVILSLDVGMPTYLPHFDLKFPLISEGTGAKMAALVREALGVLLDEVMHFMTSMGYEREAQVQLYAAALQCFESMGVDSEADAMMPEYTRDNVVKIYEGTFAMPAGFVDETQRAVVLAATKVQRIPVNRRIELTKLPPNKTNTYDVEKLIRLYRNRSLQQQPHRLFVMVYDQTGRPVGTLPADKFKSNLLKKGTIGEQEGELAAPLVGKGKLYDKGHPVKMVPKGSNPYRMEIHDAATGVPITEVNVKELVQIAS